jgi:hypothetical protein
MVKYLKTNVITPITSIGLHVNFMSIEICDFV